MPYRNGDDALETVNVAFKCDSSQQGNNCLAPFAWYVMRAIIYHNLIFFIIALNNTAQQQIFNHMIRKIWYY